MTPLNAAQLAEFRQKLHTAQRELAPVVRDDIYTTEALRRFVYHDLPELYAALERDAHPYSAKPVRGAHADAADLL